MFIAQSSHQCFSMHVGLISSCSMAEGIGLTRCFKPCSPCKTRVVAAEWCRVYGGADCWSYLPSWELTYPVKRQLLDDFPFPVVGHVSSLEGNFHRFEWHFVKLHPHYPSPCQCNVCAISFWQELTTWVRSRRSKQKVHGQNPGLVGIVKGCICEPSLHKLANLLCTHFYLKCDWCYR